MHNDLNLNMDFENELFDLEHNLRYKDSISKYVKVKTVDSREHEGWLKCIDPMSGNMFLTTFDENFTTVCETILIIGNACTNLEVMKESDEKIKSLLQGLYRVDIVCSENVTERKNRLISWIKKNRIPVVENEDESLFVCDTVTISPPYDIQNCSSLNGRVLKNIRHLISKLPPNVNSVCDK